MALLATMAARRRRRARASGAASSRRRVLLVMACHIRLWSLTNRNVTVELLEQARSAAGVADGRWRWLEEQCPLEARKKRTWHARILVASPLRATDYCPFEVALHHGVL